MKAVVIDDEQKLHWQEVDAPVAGADEVLIKIHASAINRADLIQRKGFYAPPPGASTIMGLECAGEITAVAENTTRFKVGDRVCALLSTGSTVMRLRMKATTSPIVELSRIPG